MTAPRTRLAVLALIGAIGACAGVLGLRHAVEPTAFPHRSP